MKPGIILKLVLLTMVWSHVLAVRAESAREVLCRVTVYWSKGPGTDRWTARGQSSTGVRLRRGHCAVDPKVIKYGSRLKLRCGMQLLCVDTGTAVKTRKASRGRVPVVDVYFPTRRQALAWDARNPDYQRVKIYRNGGSSTISEEDESDAS